MEIAKLSGNINKFNELNNMSKTIKTEINRNPELITVFAKVFTDYEENNQQDDFIDNDKQQNFTTPRIDQINENQIIQKTNDVSKFNTLLKNTMNSILNSQKPLDEVNLLLDMTDGQAAENFISSKSDTELPKKSDEVNIELGCSKDFSLYGITDIFDIAAFQRSGNYRTSAPKNLAPINLPKNKKQSKSKTKTKSGLSTLAIIREESRFRSNSKSLKDSQNSKLRKNCSSMPNLNLKKKL